MQAFKEGFETVFPLSSLSCFTPEEVYYQIFLRRAFEPLWVTCNIQKCTHLKRKHLKVCLLIFTNIYYIVNFFCFQMDLLLCGSTAETWDVKSKSSRA